MLATVQITPKNPTWPGNDIAIRIRLDDTKGGGPAPDIELHPRVLVDVTPVDVAWTVHGGELRGTVASRDSGGRPHVVRVEVADQHGLEIGRGFLEVGAEKAVVSR